MRGDELVDGRRFVDREADHQHVPAGRRSARSGRCSGISLHAGRTPRCPEIEHDEAAADVRVGERAAVGRLDRRRESASAQAATTPAAEAAAAAVSPVTTGGWRWRSQAPPPSASAPRRDAGRPFATFQCEVILVPVPAVVAARRRRRARSGPARRASSAPRRSSRSRMFRWIVIQSSSASLRSAEHQRQRMLAAAQRLADGLVVDALVQQSDLGRLDVVAVQVEAHDGLPRRRAAPHAPPT